MWGCFQVKSLPPLDLLLITQSLDDHCHLATLQRLAALQPGLRVIATPNAEAKMEGLFRNASLPLPFPGYGLGVRRTEVEILEPGYTWANVP